MLDDFIIFAKKAGFTDSEILELKKHYSAFMTQNEKQNFSAELSDRLFDKTYPTSALCSQISEISSLGSLNSATFSLILFLYNLSKLDSVYKADGIEEWIFIDTIRGMRRKCFERSSLDSVDIGIDCPAWVMEFFRLNHFGLGRFQFCLEPFGFDVYSKKGVTVKNGEKIVAVHIPSGAGLTKEVRMDSYKKAYDFYKKRGVFTDGIMRAVCHSWMLYPEYVQKVYSKESNLYGFSTDYDLFYVREDQAFKDGWRIFGAGFNDEFKDLPQNTSLQKSFCNYFNENKKFGVGYGMLLFDGEKIL